MSYTVKELRTLAKQKNIKNILNKSKEALCHLLDIPFDVKNDSYQYLKTIQKKPKVIALTNHQTNEKYTFKSIYKCAKYFNVNSGLFSITTNRYNNQIVITSKLTASASEKR